MATDKIEVRLYQNSIPEFVESALENLYENIFSSLSFLKAFNQFPAAIHTYVLEQDLLPQVVLLFRIEGRRVKVLNESMSISAREIERFAAYVFSHFSQVDMVSLNAVRTDPGPISYPCQRFACLQDIVVHLPHSQDEYLASLSKATRKNIKRYMNKARLDLPGLKHEVLVGAAIEEQHVRDIIELNKARMQRKQKISTYDALETQQIIELAKRCGFIRIMKLDGVIVAGELCTRIGSHYFSHLGAHDPAYDEYRLGTLNCYLTICECIERGGKQFHFLWGQYDYKYSLRGVQQELEHVALYRSYAHLCRNGPKAIQLACKAFARSAKNLLQQTAKQASLPGRLANGTIALAKRLRDPMPTAAFRTVQHEIRTSTANMQTQVYPSQVAVEGIFELNEIGPKNKDDKEASAAVCSD